ncbi:hypothetical protein [Actinomadura sp. 21ATH]|uniref:hypothetical protein n=1 Tax=Actinomadura sp. 21ATH TaxID=1735444 RepID=UPI0035BF5AF4
MAAFLALGVIMVVTGVSWVPAAGGFVPADRVQAAGWSPAVPARSAVDVVPAVQAPGRAAPAAFPADPFPPPEFKSSLPPEFEGTSIMKTVDGDPGGELRWKPPKGADKTAKIRVYDLEEDGHYVTGEVTLDGAQVATVRAGGKGADDVASIPGYSKDKVYEFKVCLGTEHGTGYCNTSTSKKWPEVDRKEDHCDTLDGDKRIDCIGGPEEACARIDGPAKEYCLEGNGGSGEGPEHSGTESTKIPKAPNAAPPPKIGDRPDLSLPRYHSAGAGKAAEPVGVILRWLVWTAFGACIAGVFLVCGNMALRHKRGEAGAHIADLGWVMVAIVVTGGGVAMAFIVMVVDPLW